MKPEAVVFSYYGNWSDYKDSRITWFLLMFYRANTEKRKLKFSVNIYEYVF
jgi:hypothetical protein